MRIIKNTIYLSASDLSTHISCVHATFLNLQLARKLIPTPHVYSNPSLEVLQQKGQEFEDEYINELKAGGKTIAEIPRGDSDKAVMATMEAMRQGADIIYQARLEYGIWNGWADFLIRTGKPGRFGNWSYEVMDTKLSKETKAGAILQISLYSEMLEQLQGCKPEYMHIRNPAGEYHYRTDDFAAYYRLMKRNLLEATSQASETYPDPVPHCEICRWWQVCNQRRRQDDHLGFVAGMGVMQIREVNKWGVTTLESMAELAVPLVYEPATGSVETFEKLAHQARLQRTWRMTSQPVFELLPLEEGFGFYQLPEPSVHDIFFDFEGDPYVGDTGLEYLFGWYYQDEYHELWAPDDAAEKQALEQFIDRVMEIWEQDKGMHIYHFGAYEQSALKRIVGKYATKEDELDRLLRARVFVNLHTIVKHAVIAGVESYSLKDLEKLHGYLRIRDLRLVVGQKILYEGLLESGYAVTADAETIAVVRDYNKDDCISTKYLRDWLEAIRRQVVDAGNDIPRPEQKEEEPSEKITAHQERIQPLFDELMKGIPFEKENRTAEQQAKWLLANMLDWYRREKKSFWWEFFRLSALPDEELIEENDALAGLVYTGKQEQVKRSMVHYYSFPEQDLSLKPGNKVSFKEKGIGEIHSLDTEHRIVGIKKTKAAAGTHPTHIICRDDIPDTHKEEALIRLAGYVAQNGMAGEGNYQAGRKLLSRAIELPVDPSTIDEKDNAAIVQVMQMNNNVLAIQGPPGTGKSHTASLMIISLIKAGKKIGVSALSHKVITELLEKVVSEGTKDKMSINIVQKVGEFTVRNSSNWIETKDDYKLMVDSLQNGFQIAAGTSFMWARDEFFGSVDFLFVDEAGQLSLIDTLALSHAGKNLVLMGDPQQLKQPLKGTHPEGTEVSALEHILQGHKTMADNQGVFLGTTWRMHPAINDYISELFYDDRLHTMPQNAEQQLRGNTVYQEPGLYVETVAHEGNQNSSPEEVEKVTAIVSELLHGGVYWLDSHGKEQALKANHIKIISPYNAQVELLKDALPGIQAGTVDKFQGQEAPVIIYSMATSSPEDAPRGMEFLYGLNRFNVAVSRTRAVFILVASPALFQPACRSPHQMQLANALCRLREMAKN